MFNRIVKRVKKVLDKIFMRACGNSSVLSSFYYFFINDSFRREHQAVLAGKIKHLDETRKDKANYFLLTRNIHRIEKGLLMRPKRAVFAKEYLAETIDSFEGIWKRDDLQTNPQMKWFHDVLEDYFASSGEDMLVAQQRSRFKQILNGDTHVIADDSCEVKSVPYPKPNYDHAISFDQFMLLARQRRSVRWFLDKPVPRELLDKAVLVANQSPSACNRQPFEYRIFDEPELVKEVVGYPMGTTGYGHSIPVMVVVVGNLDAYFDERDRHIIYIDASLANMSFMFALETLGLSSCAINWPDIESREKRMESFLRLEKHQRPIMCIGVGYSDPEGMVAFSAKRPLSQIRKYN